MIQQGIGSLWANGAQTAGDHPSFFRLKHLRIITTHSGWDMLVHCRVPPISISPVSIYTPGPSCSKLGQDNPGLVRDLNSDLKV